MGNKKDIPRKKTLAVLAKEIDDKRFSDDPAGSDAASKSKARTYERNFELLLETLNVEKGRFKNKRGWYEVNRGKEVFFKIMLEETTIKGSFFNYAKDNRHDEASF